MSYRVPNHSHLVKNGFVLVGRAEWMPEFTGREDEKLRYAQELMQNLSASSGAEIYVAEAVDNSDKPAGIFVVYKKVI